MVRKDALVGSWDELQKLRLDGIVSANDFRRQPFTFDFVHKLFVLETPKTLRQRKREGSSSRLTFDDQRGIILDLFAQFQLAGQPVQCELDTGSPTATLGTRFMASLGIAKEGPTVRPHTSRTIGGATETRYDTTLPQVSLTAVPAGRPSTPCRILFRQYLRLRRGH